MPAVPPIGFSATADYLKYVSTPVPYKVPDKSHLEPATTAASAIYATPGPTGYLQYYGNSDHYL